MPRWGAAGAPEDAGQEEFDLFRGLCATSSPGRTLTSMTRGGPVNLWETGNGTTLEDASVRLGVVRFVPYDRDGGVRFRGRLS